MLIYTVPCGKNLATVEIMDLNMKFFWSRESLIGVDSYELVPFEGTRQGPH